MLVTKEFKKDLRDANVIISRFFDEEFTLEFKQDDLKKGDWIKKGKSIIYKEIKHNRKKGVFINYHVLTDTWKILSMIIKRDDYLLFSCSTNNSTNLNKAKLFKDELYCSVYRNNKQIIHRFVLSYVICGNNSARAIRRSNHE